MFVHTFEGHDHGNDDGWEAHIRIEIRDENDKTAGFSTVLLAWGGSQPGNQLLASNQDGKIDVRIGEFDNDRVTFRIIDVQLAGFTYQPALNAVSSTLVVEGSD